MPNTAETLAQTPVQPSDSEVLRPLRPITPPAHVQKRSGEIIPFDAGKIRSALRRAGAATGEFDDAEAGLLTAQVVKVLSHRFAGRVPDIERIQDAVEQALISANHFLTMRAYSVYREQRAKLRQDKKTVVDVASSVNEYLDRHDWRVNANANQGYSLGGLILNVSGKVTANYWLNHVYPAEVGRAHREGDLHIHDLDMLSGYCAGWSLRTLLAEGLNGVPGKVEATAPRHLSSAVGQIVNFLGTLQNEWAGAQAFNNVDTYLAPFVRHDQLSYNEVRQAMQKFVFNLNTTSRWGGQSPFTNLSFDLVPPKHIAGEAVIIGGKLMDSTYGEYAAEMEMINKAFLEVMFEGDYNSRIFSFPIPTYNVTKDFPWDSEIGELLLKLTAKYGVPYFQNFINSDLSPEDVRSMCCRLQMDLRELRKKTGGLFGAGDLTGSIGVVTLNLPKLAYLSQSEEDFLDLITEYAELAKNSLEFKRKLITNNLENGMFPWSRRYLKNGYKGHFSTIGLLGGHEACLNLLGKGIETETGIRFMRRTLNHLRDLTARFQEETGNLYNLEATPAEGTSYRLAKIDKSLYSEIVAQGTDTPYYTNSTALPVSLCDDVIMALEHQNQLQPLYTGGTVFHTFLGEAATDLQALKAFIIKAFSMTKIPYLSITPTFSICKEHGYLRGEQEACPDCGAETEIYTRIVGYYRPVSRWNKGKQAEYMDRVTFQDVC